MNGPAIPEHFSLHIIWQVCYFEFIQEGILVLTSDYILEWYCFSVDHRCWLLLFLLLLLFMLVLLRQPLQCKAGVSWAFIASYSHMSYCRYHTDQQFELHVLFIPLSQLRMSYAATHLWTICKMMYPLMFTFSFHWCCQWMCNCSPFWMLQWK